MGVKDKTLVSPEKTAVTKGDEEGEEGGEKEGAGDEEDAGGEKAAADGEGSPRAGTEGTIAGTGTAGAPTGEPTGVADEIELVEMKPEPPRELPPDGPEYDALKNRLKEFDLDWAIVATTVSSIGIQPTEIGIDAIDADQLFIVACRTIESTCRVLKLQFEFEIYLLNFTRSITHITHLLQRNSSIRQRS